MANRPALAGSFIGTGQSDWFQLDGDFDLDVWGTWSGGWQLERSYDGGVTAIPVETFTANASRQGRQNATACMRINVTSLSSGTLNYRLAQ